MLFKQKDLQDIAIGKVNLAFRKWKRASVKKGTLLKTAIGQVEIVEIQPIKFDSIELKDAKSAGYSNLSELHAALNARSDGIIYRIIVSYHSPDPRIKLRNQINLSEEEILIIQKKLKRMDNSCRNGPWTVKILELIRDNPKVRAKDLAEKTGMTKDWLKPNIRKLKNLGLTISHPLGYEISPRGKIVLESCS